MKTVQVVSFACEFICTFATAEAADTFQATILQGIGPIGAGEIAQTAYFLGGSVRAVSGVEALTSTAADAYADTLPTIPAARAV